MSYPKNIFGLMTIDNEVQDFILRNYSINEIKDKHIRPSKIYSNKELEHNISIVCEKIHNYDLAYVPQIKIPRLRNAHIVNDFHSVFYDAFEFQLDINMEKT